MPRIYVIGALVYDLVFNVPDWLEPNRAVHATQVTLSPGGKALNQATAARRLGADVSLIGSVGADLFGREMLNAMCQEGVNIDFVFQHETAQTSLASIIVKDKVPGFVGAPDASRKISESNIRDALSELQSDDILLVDFEIPQSLVQFALETGRDAGAVTVLNPAPFFTRDSFVFNYLHLVDVIIPNKLEAQLIVDGESDDADELARQLLGMGINQIVLTIGDEGSILYEAACKIKQPAFSVDVVDTTGASDAFVGAYCLGLLKKSSLVSALEFAAAAAALSCTKHGTMSSIPDLSDVKALLRKHLV